MSKKVRVSASEWELMKVLWAKHPLTSSEIVEALAGRTKWTASTIKTLLARLVRKGAVRADSRTRDYRYIPAISEQQFTRSESRSFLRRVYDGATMPFIVGLLEQEKLSSEEIAELRKLLDEMEKGRDK